jgi:hypothetical protein
LDAFEQGVKNAKKKRFGAKKDAVAKKRIYLCQKKYYKLA